MSGLSVHRVGDSHVRQLRDDDGYIATFGATDADLLDLARQLAPGMVLIDRETLTAFRAFVRAWDHEHGGKNPFFKTECVTHEARAAITSEMMGDD